MPQVPQPTGNRRIRVFISSTFRDMHAERDHLVTVVFPELRERVEQLGLEFFDVDLRWGVPAKDANGETANSWEYCRQWIDRVEPFFVCILGQRYGWVPEPEQLQAWEDRQRQQVEQRSITDMEVRHAVLNTKLKRRSYFYLRATDAPATATEYVDPPPLLRKLEQLKQEVRSCGRPVRDYPCEWTGSGFASLEEFGRRVLDDLWSGVLHDERYVSKEVWRQALGADPDSDARYADESKPVPPALAEKLVALAKPAPLSLLAAEKQQMETFAQARLRWFQGRTKELKQLTDFINSTDEKSPRLAAVVAVPGQGKSALFAKLWQEVVRSSAFTRPGPAEAGTSNTAPGERPLTDPSDTLSPSDGERDRERGYFIIVHFVGATERSANAHNLVERLLGELDRSGIKWPAEQQEGQEPKRDFNSLCLRLAQRLGDYAGERRIVILLDALNQLSDGHDLHWLPHRLGRSVRVIISCVEEPRSSRREEAPSEKAESRKPKAEIDQSLLTSAATPKENEQRLLNALASRQPVPLLVPLGPLTEDDVRIIVVAYLAEYCHELDREHLDTLCDIRQARNPLYLLVMLNELRTLGGNDLNRIVPARIAAMPQDHPDTVSLFRWVLQRLEVFGPEAVRWWCLYLACGRVGMASHELADLLARKLGADAAATALRIERGLRRYLQRCGPQLDFFHSQIRQAVFEQYGPQAEATSVHSDIADYFRNFADPEKNQSWKGDNPRPFLELPFHLARANADELATILFNFNWLQAKTDKALVHELIQDYDEAFQALPANYSLRRPLQLLQGGLRLSAHVISKDSMQLASQLVGRMSNFEELETKRPLDAARAWRGTPWLRPVNTNLYMPGRGLERTIYVSSIVTTVVVTPDKRRAVSGSKDGTLKVWDLESGRELSSLQTDCGFCHDTPVVAITLDGRWAVSASKDETLKVWDLEGGRELCSLPIGDNAPTYSKDVTAVGVTRDRRLAVLAYRHSTLKLYDLERGQKLHSIETHSFDTVTAVVLTPDGRRAVCASENKKLHVYDLETGQQISTLQGHGSWVTAIVIREDGRRAVSGSEDCTLTVWDLESSRELHTFKSHSRGVSALAITPDGRRVVSASKDKTIKVWDLEGCRELHTLQGHSREVTAVAITPDGRRVVSASYDRTIKFWDLENDREPQMFKGHSRPVSVVTVTPDGRRAISASEDGCLKVWDLKSGRELLALEGKSSGIKAIALTPDGRLAVSPSENETLMVWDSKSGWQPLALQGNYKYVTSVALTPNGRQAVSASRDCDPCPDGHPYVLNLWDLDIGQIVRTFRGWCDYETNCIALSRDGRRAIFSFLGQASVMVWNPNANLPPVNLRGHKGTITALAITPNGRQAVSGSTDGTLRVWDLKSLKELRILEGHNQGRCDFSSIPLAVTTDGCLTVSAHWDHALNVWDLESGHYLATFTSDSIVSCCAIAPDGRTLVAGDVSGHIHFLKLVTPEDPIDESCPDEDRK